VPPKSAKVVLVWAKSRYDVRDFELNVISHDPISAVCNLESIVALN
jgi:hypothetical protein